MSQERLAARLVTILEQLLRAVAYNRRTSYYCREDHAPIAKLFSEAQGLAAALALDKLRPLEESGLLLHDRSYVPAKTGPDEPLQDWPCYTPVPGWFEKAHRWQVWDEAALHTLDGARAISAALQPASHLSPPHADDAPPPAEEATPLPALLSAPDLARRLGQPIPKVESALRRFRVDHPDCCEEVDNRRRNEPKYLYRTTDVLPFLKRLAADG